MKMEIKEIKVPGQLTGPARLTGYILEKSPVEPERKRPAIILCPGGGYRIRSEREGEPVALKFTAMGCHAFVLDYSVAPNRYPVSLRELAEVTALIRERSDEWKLDSDRVLVCGLSAGGHLACALGVMWNQEELWSVIGRKPEEIRPDGMILCYPVITGGRFAHVGSFQCLLGDEMTEEGRKALSLELLVTKETPRAFIWHTFTDETVPVENSLLLASAMASKGVNAELHLYPKGGHGLSLASEETACNSSQVVEYCQNWVDLVKTWLKEFF